MRLNMHARIEIAIVATLLLGSCGDSASQRFTVGDYKRIESADANARNAWYYARRLESRIDDLESEVNNLKYEVRSHQH